MATRAQTARIDPRPGTISPLHLPGRAFSERGFLPDPGSWKAGPRVATREARIMAAMM